MANANVQQIYEELAQRYGLKGEPRHRDHCLVLAADAALTAGQRDEAERLRRRLLQVNPHHLLRPFASLAEALGSSDVQDYIADLRQQWPADVAAKVLQGQRHEDGDLRTDTIVPLLPPSEPVRPVPPRPAVRQTAPAATPAPPRPPIRPVAAVPAPVVAAEATTPTRSGRLLADLLFLLGILVVGALATIALAWPFLEEVRMDLELRGSTAIVVGGGRGIGKAITVAFAQAGADLALIDRDAGLTEVGPELAAAHQVGCSTAVADVTDYAAMQRAAAQFRRERGRLDHLVFAVAIGSGKFGFPFWNLEPGDWTRVLQVNVVGAANVLHAFAPALVEAKAGTILLIASVAGQIGSQTDPPYSASKAALINFGQCAARDLAPHNVRVNTLCPGMVKTDLNRAVWEAWHRQQPDDQKQSYEEWAGEKVRRVVPLGRWQEPADIANMAVFLASARAHNVTGQTINVDGGFVMHW